MAYESIKVDIIPGAENAEVLHFSQFDNKRPFFIELFNGTDEFIPDQGMSLTLECRKRDGNIVIISDPVMNDNVAEFSTTEQLTACYGDNEAEIKIVDENDLVIGSANFIINVEKSPTCGGITSQSDIDNLTQQIEEITQEVIGEDYYNKTEVDRLLDDKADVSDLPDMSQYYTKQQTDNLLDDKADVSDLPDMSQYYTKQQTDNMIINILPVGTASGNPCSFDTEIAGPLQGLTAEIVASGGGGTPATPIPIVGHSELNLVRCGVNLWNENAEQGTINADTGENEANIYAGIRSTNYIPVKPSTTYYYNGNGYISAFFQYGADKSYLGRDKFFFLNSGMTFTTEANTHYIRFRTDYGYGQTYNNDISINYPSSDTSYHAYNGETFTVQFGQTVYGGVYDANMGKVRITWGAVDLGTLDYSDATSGGIHYFYINGSQVSSLGMKEESYPTSLNIKSPIFTAKSNNNYIGGALTNDYEFCRNASNVCFRYDSISSTVDFKTAMNNIIFAYELATPIEIDVSELAVDTIVGVNNITSDCGGDVNVSYKDTIQHYIDSRI